MKESQQCISDQGWGKVNKATGSVQQLLKEIVLDLGWILKAKCAEK